jgi:hypothetical protein
MNTEIKLRNPEGTRPKIWVGREGLTDAAYIIGEYEATYEPAESCEMLPDA